MNRKSAFLTTTMGVCLTAMVCCALWGSAFPCIKIGYQLFQIDGNDISSQLLFAGCRFTLAGLLTILLGSLMNRRPLIPRKTSWIRIAKLSLFQTVIQYLFFYVGLAHTTGVMLFYLAAVSAVAYSLWGILLKLNPVSKVAVFGFMNPVFGVILSALFLGEGQQAFGLTAIGALVLVCIGIYIVNKQQ